MAARRWLRVAGEYFCAGLLCLGLLTWLLDLPHRDLSVPFDYAGDSLQFHMWVKAVVEDGWYLQIGHASAPYRLDMYDFPMSDNVYFLLAKLLACWSSDATVVFNLYYLATFLLTAWTSLFVLRHFGVAFAPALVGCIVYAFMPFHFLYGQAAFTLSSYYLIPLMVMVVLWLFRGEWTWGRWLGGAAVALLMSAGGVYFAFFSCFFLAIAGMASWANQRRWLGVGRAWVLIALIAVGSVLNILPSVLYAARHGQNLESANRMMGEAEHYGLRVSQLLMPASGHRIPFLAWVKAKFNQKLMLVTENDKASLGLCGSIGFLFLLFRLLVRRREDVSGPAGLLEPLSLLNVFAVLLATIGGLGLLCAAAFPHIRSYTRIAVFIGFFAVFAGTLWLDAAYRARRRSQTSGFAWALGLGGLIVIAVLDQTPGVWSQAESPHAQEFRDDVQFARQIEEHVAEGAMVYQYPYRVWPEGVRLDQLRWPVHSRRVHWSFPSMRGRLPDLWLRNLASKPREEWLPTLAYAGFAGVLLDRIDFNAKDRTLETELAKTLAAPALIHPNQRWVFYPLTDYVARLKSRHSAAEWAALQKEALEPVLVSWKRGFSQFEENLGHGGRWCGANGELVLYNLSDQPQSVRVSAAFATGHDEPARLHIASALFDSEVELTHGTGALQTSVTMPPGPHLVRFSCNARCAQDSQRKVFKVLSYQVQRQLE